MARTRSWSRTSESYALKNNLNLRRSRSLIKPTMMVIALDTSTLLLEAL